MSLLRLPSRERGGRGPPPPPPRFERERDRPREGPRPPNVRRHPPRDEERERQHPPPAPPRRRPLDQGRGQRWNQHHARPRLPPHRESLPGRRDGPPAPSPSWRRKPKQQRRRRQDSGSYEARYDSDGARQARGHRPWQFKQATHRHESVRRPVLCGRWQPPPQQQQHSPPLKKRRVGVVEPPQAPPPPLVPTEPEGGAQVVSLASSSCVSEKEGSSKRIDKTDAPLPCQVVVRRRQETTLLAYSSSEKETVVQKEVAPSLSSHEQKETVLLLPERETKVEESRSSCFKERLPHEREKDHPEIPSLESHDKDPEVLKSRETDDAPLEQDGSNSSSDDDDSDTDDEEVLAFGRRMFGLLEPPPPAVAVVAPVVVEKPPPFQKEETHHNETTSSPLLHSKEADRLGLLDFDVEYPPVMSLGERIKLRQRSRSTLNSKKEPLKSRDGAKMKENSKQSKPLKKKGPQATRRRQPTQGQVVVEDATVSLLRQKQVKESKKPPTAAELEQILQEDFSSTKEQASWVRRSVRQPSAGIINSPQVRNLLDKLEHNDTDMEVLKLKKYMPDPDTPAVVVDAALDALEENHNCQALYIQNFNQGMRDEQVLHLLSILQLDTCKIWCLNIGETYNVKTKTWKIFAKGLKKTKITHMYASEHTISATLKEDIREIIRKNRKKHDMHCNPDNLDVIVQCTHCWWNPINAKCLRPYLKSRGYEHILYDKERQGLLGSHSAAPTGEQAGAGEEQPAMG